MLPSSGLPVPATWQGMLAEFAPVFSRRSAHRLFVVLASAMILADRSTVTGMPAAAGLAGQWRRARAVLRRCRLGRRRPRRGDRLDGGEVPAQRRRRSRSPAPGRSRRSSSGCRSVPRRRRCRREFRLWRGKGTASQVELAAQLLTVLAGAFGGRAVRGAGDAAFRGQPLLIEGVTWTARLPSSAVPYGPKPQRAGRRGRPRVKGGRLGTCAQAAASATWTDAVIRAYAKDTTVQVTAVEALW